MPGLPDTDQGIREPTLTREQAQRCKTVLGRTLPWVDRNG
jgi:hypothetical protein